MAGQKRTDNKGRILKDGETQRKDGSYRFTYRNHYEYLCRGYQGSEKTVLCKSRR